MLDELLRDGLEALLNPADRRREVARGLPDAVALRLAQRISPEERARLRDQLLSPFWRELHRERGERWDRGWAELVGGFAVAIELLAGELPRPIRRATEETPAQRFFEQERLRFARHALVVDTEAYPRRMFVAPGRVAESGRIEDGLTWELDGGEPQGRSHTLLLGLMAHNMLDVSLGEVAATGELDADGRTVRPVNDLVLKLEAWRKWSPKGTVITAPLGPGVDPEAWQKLVAAYPSGEIEPRQQWYSGGSLDELEAKLHAPLAAIPAWNGRPLQDKDVVEPDLEVDETDPKLPRTGFPLLEAAWAASSDPIRRGVWIEGGPGLGKSVLSRKIERDFRTGPLGALGFGVRRAARHLASDLRALGSMDPATVLGRGEPARRSLFDVLVSTRRLVLIVDGVDELSSTDARTVSAFLRRVPGWWIVTSRPVRHVGGEFPPAWRLRLGEYSSEHARELLRAHGREDLAERLCERGFTSESSRPDSALVALTKSPLHVAMLACVVRQGEDPKKLSAHALYQRTFQALLEHAAADERLTQTQVELLKTQRDEIVGRLAIEWLRGDSGFLEGPDLDLALEDAGVQPAERANVIEALTFGHLLAPAGDGWEFAHRTLAEWAAANALIKEVQRKWRREGRSSDPLVRRRIEQEVLRPYLCEQVLFDRDRWTTLLRFYVVEAIDPLGLLEQLVGRHDRTRWRVEEQPRLDDSWRNTRPPTVPADVRRVLGSWAAVFEMLSEARWSVVEEARTAWALAVRRWILCEDAQDELWSPSESIGVLTRFAAAVSHCIPESWTALVELAARNSEQRERLLREPKLLLPAVPPARADAVAALLSSRDPVTQRAACDWYERHGLSVDQTVVDRLIGQGVFADTPEERELEAAAWNARLRLTGELPWATVRKRTMAWPAHLDEPLRRWFKRAEAGDGIAPSPDMASRRELFAAVVAEATRIDRELTRELALLRGTDEGIERVQLALGRFDSSTETAARYLLQEAITGWEQSRRVTGSPTDRPRPLAEAEKLANTVRRLSVLRRRLQDIVRELSAEMLSGVCGELWALLPHDSAERRELLQVISGTERIPPQVPADVVLAAIKDDHWRLTRLAWSPTHEKELEALAGAAGPLALRALRALAALKGQDETIFLLKRVAHSSEPLRGAILEQLLSSHLSADVPIEDLPEDLRLRLPLSIRVRHRIGSWKPQLLAALADPARRDVDELARAAAEVGERDALRPLAAHLPAGPRRGSTAVIEAIAALVDESDSEIAGKAVESALRLGWPWRSREAAIDPADHRTRRPSAGRSLACFLTIDHLPVLAESGVSVLEIPALAAALQNLGRPAHERLRELFREATSALGQLESEKNAEGPLVLKNSESLRRAKQRVKTLAESLVASLDVTCGLTDVVELAFLVAFGDVHEVYSTFGPLGSEFDEPADLDWDSRQENEQLVNAIGRCLEAALARAPGEWPRLRALFRHPSESLRRRAFELSASSAAPHEIAELAIEALEGHLRKNQTRWVGNTAGLLMASLQSGAGSIYVDTPTVAGELVKAIRRCLTPAHRSVIERLLGHENPQLQGLALRWAGELGDPEWLECLRPFLSSPNSGLALSAFRAIALVEPDQLDAEVSRAERSQWTLGHFGRLFHLLARPPQRHVPWEIQEPQVNAAALLSEITLQELVDGAARQATAAPESPRGSSPFDDFPSPIEQLASQGQIRLSEELLRTWARHPAASIRAVAFRLLAQQGALDAGLLRQLLEVPHPGDRLAAAECLTMLGDIASLDALESLWRAALRPWLDEDDCRTLGIELEIPGARARLDQIIGSPEEVTIRLFRALKSAGPSFAPLFVLVAEHLSYDHSDGDYTEQAQRIIDEIVTIVTSWGDDGLVALVQLMDQHCIESEPYEFRRMLQHRCGENPAFRAALEAGGEVSLQVLEDWQRSVDESDLEALAMRLAKQVFPPTQEPSPSAA